LAADNEGRNDLHHLLEYPQMEEEAVLYFLRYVRSEVSVPL
jgi:hypothetical protein